MNSITKTSLGLMFLFFVTPLLSFQPPEPIAPAGSIQFIEQDWSRALREAKEQHKPILMDAYAVWCGPCKMLKQTTFTNQRVADFFNEHFINVAVDMESGVGPGLLEALKIEMYPTLIVFDENGQAVTRSVGFIQPWQMLQFGKKALRKVHKEK